MKNRLLLSILSFTILALGACKKEENKVFFEGGTPPVFTASSTDPIVLLKDDAEEMAVKFSWTNPDYEFNTGVNSHDVNYIIQADLAGANFSSPDLQEVAIPRDLSYEYLVKDLNQIPKRMNLAENVPHNLEFRIKSTLANNSVPLFSNVIPLTITPYLDVAVPIPPTGELYLTGSAVGSGWTNTPPADQKFTQVSPTLYEITTNLPAFASGIEYKFLSTQGAWQPQYGGSNAAGGDLGFNMGLPGQSDPPAIPAPAVAGTYKITVNFITGKYSVVQQ